MIASMPARASSATVTLSIVTLGIAASPTYVYASKSATMAAPAATAGINSVTLTWAAPASNGSPITSYVVTPYLSGVAQTPLIYDGSATTRTITGLASSSVWAYTIAAVNDFGTSVTSPKSSTVIPYALPGPPTITSVRAGSAAVTLTWNSPNTNGSTITGYVIAPYIGAVAQTVQTFAGSASSRTAVGLTPGTEYTFTAAAVNAAGTGPASRRSLGATPNGLPSSAFPAPPATPARSVTRPRRAHPSSRF